MSPALEDSCLDQSDADLFHLSEENRRLKKRLKEAGVLIDRLEDVRYQIEDIADDLRAMVGDAAPTPKSGGSSTP